MKYPIFAPDTSYATLIYNDAIITRTNLGASWLYYRFRGNSIFDPDVGLGTGGISGLAEWGGLYRIYLAEGNEGTWTVTNNENFPVVICFAPGFTDLAASISSASNAADIGEVKHRQTRLLAPKGSGGATATIKFLIDWVTFIGNGGEYMFSAGYRGFLGAVPSNPTVVTYLHFTAFAASPFTLGGGIGTMLNIEYKCKFFDLQVPIDR